MTVCKLSIVKIPKAVQANMGSNAFTTKWQYWFLTYQINNVYKGARSSCNRTEICNKP